MTFKQAERTLREKHNLALAYGPHNSVGARPRWFTANDEGHVIAEGSTWREAYANTTKHDPGGSRVSVPELDSSGAA